MLTISQLAAYAGVTVATVRHYHRIGLLPEPERNYSGYRTYDADAVVRLIKIRVLAEAGVPLSRVEHLLAADPQDFDAALVDIDQRLRGDIRRLQAARKRLGELAGGERIALPASVIGYLDRMRSLGVDEDYLAIERDAWIIVAAQMPDRIDEIIATKHTYLDNPEMVRFYRLVSGALTWGADDPRLVELADLMDRIVRQALAADLVPDYGMEASVHQLLDAYMVANGPAAQRFLELLTERGWRRWADPAHGVGPEPDAGVGRRA